jgi:hypothetical protein
LVGLVLRRSLTALIILILMLAALYTWGAATKTPDDLYLAARRTGQHVLSKSNEVPPGDDGFAEIMRSAFAYADENSHQSHAIFANRAAILAVGVILGDKRVARMARRSLDPKRLREAAPLRRKITLRGRGDLSKHFWVSAALTVVSDENRSMSVGIGKELMDSTSGGTGFSFVDMAANYSGIRFAGRATRSEVSARDLQAAIRSGLTADDFCPDIAGLPEGLSSDQFHSEFGGLGGKRTRELMAEIRRRLNASAGLAP